MILQNALSAALPERRKGKRSGIPPGSEGLAELAGVPRSRADHCLYDDVLGKQNRIRLYAMTELYHKMTIAALLNIT